MKAVISSPIPLLYVVSAEAMVKASNKTFHVLAKAPIFRALERFLLCVPSLSAIMILVFWATFPFQPALAYSTFCNDRGKIKKEEIPPDRRYGSVETCRKAAHPARMAARLQCGGGGVTVRTTWQRYS